MSTTQTLTDDQAAAIWSGDTASIINFGETQVTTETETQETTTTADDSDTTTKPNLFTEEDIDDIFREGNKTEEEDEDDTEETNTNNSQSQQTTNAAASDDTKKAGRKAADLVNTVNQLIEEEILFGYEGEEIKTIEDAKELIRANLKYKEENVAEEVWKKKVETYSPQIQAIIDYAEKGGQDVSSLLGAISEVEKTVSLDIQEVDGQEEIIRQTLKIKGFDDEEIKDQIETLKDLDKLKAKAEKFLPELNRMKEERINLMMQEQSERQEQAKEAAKVYLDTIQTTLTKEDVGGIKLKREDKAKIMDALALPKYKSINGYTVNQFVKVLEDLQFGKNANYDHFLNIVQFAIDREGFLSKLKENIKDTVTVDTVKKLKTAKTTSSNTEGDAQDTTSRKNVISRAGFKNPFK